EYGVSIDAPLRARGISASDIHGIAISNVVPPVQQTLEWMCEEYFGQAPFVVEPGVNTRMPLDVDAPREVGADRYVDAFAGSVLYGPPVIVVNFGTATAFNCVNERCAFIGGAIAHGRARRRPPEAHGAAAPLRGSASRDARALTRAAPGGYTHTKYSVTARGRSLYTAIGQGTGGGLRGGELMGMWVGRGRKARVA